MKPLFVSPTNIDSGLEKLAYRTKLGSNPNEWGMEVLDAVYKEHPYLKAYAVDVDLQRKDEGTGTAVGKVLVYPSTMTKEAASTKNRIVSMPVIVRERELAPLDVYVDKEEGTPHPADREAIESRLQSPELFKGPEPMRRKGVNHGGLDLQAPTRFGSIGAGAGYGLGGGGDQTSGTLMKTASSDVITALSKKLKTNDPDVISRHIERAENLGVDPMKPKPLAKTASVWQALAPRLDLEKVAAYLKPAAHDIEGVVREVASAVDASVSGRERVDVAQVYGSPGNYMVKTASREAFAPSTRRISDHQARELAGDRYSELAQNGYVTLVQDPVEEPETMEKLASYGHGAGVGQVSVGGRRVEANVFPQVHTLHGLPLSYSLVLGEGWYAEPEKVAAANVRPLEPSKLPAEYGHGRVIPVDDDGIAYEPLEILNVAASFEKVAARARRLLTGQEITIHFEPELRKVAHVHGGEYAFPEVGNGIHFLPYPEYEAKRRLDSSLVEDAAFSLEQADSMVKVAVDGSAWRVWGPAKVQGEYDQAGLEFALGALGIGPQRTKALVKTASLYRDPVEISGVHELGDPAPEQVRNLGPQSTSWRDTVRYLFDEDGQELLKTAGLRLKGQTPSALLALDFVTPENASMYVGYLPDLEKAASHLAELLVASRLGYDDIRERSAKNAMTQLQAVVSDLRTLDNKVH